jgi:hypothetical protein
MGNRTAKFISALFASVLAGAPLSAVSQNAESAPAAQNENASTTDDDCLGSPKATAPQGHHWYYRLERGTKRQCWYLREEGAKVSQSTSAQTSAAQNAPSTAPAPKTATPAPRSVQDARAEFTTQEPAPAPDTTASIPAPAAAVTPPPANPRPNVAADSSAQQPAIAARWPDTPNAAPAPQVAPATAVAEAQPAQQPAASPAPVTPAVADVPSGKPTGSLQTLLLVIGGALALAGITASFIYRFAGSKARAQASERRRRVNWEQPADNAHAPWAGAAGAGALSPRAERHLRTERPRPVDFGIALTAAANGRSATEMRSGHLEIKTIEPEDMAPEYDDDIEIETAAVDEQLETIDAHVDETADPDADEIDISAITAILELLAKEGPRLSEPNSEAGFADFAQTRRGQSAARA